MPLRIHVNFGIEDYPKLTTRCYHTYAKRSQVYQNSRLTMKVYAMDVNKGRTSRTLFPKKENKAEGILELIHLDVCGPIPSSSMSGYVYYVSFIDDYSHKTWFYFLKSKDQVFNKFNEFKALIENLSERKIKILRLDNGGEYTSKEFVSFCKDVGIKRDLTAPYNPQQNGVAERKNRMIMEAMNTMIHDQDLPMCLWAEASMTVVYV
jgi:transposase InsO family protein